MHQIEFHEKVSEDLMVWYNAGQVLKIIDKIYYRLSLSAEPDGRVIKRLHYIPVPVFFEYKVRRDLRAIFYVSEKTRIIRVLGCIHKGAARKVFDRRLEIFLRRVYDFK
ncbi:MAG: hypothetical protein ABH830_01390 [Patescibacteria group bacterium]